MNVIELGRASAETKGTTFDFFDSDGPNPPAGKVELQRVWDPL